MLLPLSFGGLRRLSVPENKECTRPRRAGLALLVHVTTMSLMVTQLHADTFTTEYKPTTGLGNGLSIAVDGSGNPHLAYNRSTGLAGYFRHAFKQGGTWHYEAIVERASDFSSLAFDNGVLHGSYRDVGAADSRYATYNGTSWSTELVSSLFADEGRYTSLTFDHAGLPHIAFHEGSGADNAIHAYPSGAGGWFAWDAAGADTDTQQGLYTSIALNAQDTVFISHVGFGAGGTFRARLSESLDGIGFDTVDISPTLNATGSATATCVASTGQPIVAFIATGGSGPVVYYATRNASMAWAITPVDTLNAFASGSDLAMHLDSAGQPHIVYRKAPALMHAYLDAVQGWRRESITAPPAGISGELDMAIDGSDELHVGYELQAVGPGSAQAPVRYAHGTFGNWTNEPVEGEDDEGSYLALTTTASGQVVVAYYDAGLGDVQVSRRIVGNMWPEDDLAEVGDVGRFVSMPPRIVADFAANVAYFDVTNGTIVQRSGTYDAWNQTTIVATVPALAGLAYADSAGFGRIAYYDSAAGDLYLARLGPGGTSIVPVDQTGDVGRSCRIGITNDGVTHIVYHDATVGRLRHARFVGGAWAYLNIASGPGLGRFCAMATSINGLGVAYYDPVGGDQYWARWNGSAWSTGLVDAADDVGSSSSVAIGPGNVIEIAYYDATAGALKFAIVTETGGIADMGIVDTGNVGLPSAIVLNPTTHQAQILYYDGTLRVLKYAIQQIGGVGVEALSGLAEKLQVVPSPARTNERLRVTLTGGLRRIQSVTLYDVRGRVLNVTAPGHAEGAVEVQMPPVPSGLLFIRAVSDNGVVSTGRVVVLR